MTDLLVRGGTIVTAGGSRRADLAADGGRITAIEPSLDGLAASAERVIDATGMLLLPGVVDAHTHTRVASDREPDRSAGLGRGELGRPILTIRAVALLQRRRRKSA